MEAPSPHGLLENRLADTMPEPIRSRPVLQAAVGIVVLAGLFALSRQNYLLFHEIAELSSIAVAWSLFVLLWNTRRVSCNDALLFIAIAYGFVGCIDVFHTLAYKGMGVLHTNPSADPATQLWIAGRSLKAVCLLIFPFLLSRRLRVGYTVFGLAAVTSLLLTAILMVPIFPHCYIEGQGLTSFKLGAEYAICLTVAFAMVMLYRRRTHLDARVFRLMMASMAVVIASELAFTLYTDVYGLTNTIGHFLKIVSFFLVYQALVRSTVTTPYATIFRELALEKERLVGERQQLSLLNQVSHLFLESETLDDTLRELPKLLAAYHQVPVVAIELYDANQGEMVFAGSTGLEASQCSDLRVPVDQTISGTVARTRQAFVGLNVHDHRDYRAPALRGLGVITFLCVPMLGREGTVGTVAMADRRERPDIVASESLLQVVADHLAMEIARRQTVADSEMRHQTILRTAMEGFWLLDLEGHLLQVNETYCQMSGYTEPELLQMRITDLEASETPADTTARAQKIIEKGHDRFESLHRRKDGTVFDVEASVQYQTLGGGLFVVFLRDITERKRTEEELKRASDLLEQISSVQSSFIATGSVQATFDRLLKALIAMTDSEFGFLDEVLEDPDGSRYKVSLSISNIAWDAEAKRLYEDLRARRLEFRNLNNLAGLPALTGGLLISNDAQHDPKAGGIPKGHPPIRTFMGLPLYFGDRLVGVAGVANRAYGYDEKLAQFLTPFLSACASIIHATRQQAKEEQMVSALLESESKFRTIFEHKGTATFVFGQDSVVQECNSVFVEMTGHPKSDVVGKMKWSDFVVEEDLQRLQEYHQQRLVDGASPPLQYECRTVAKNGDIRTVIVNISLVGEQRIVTLTDITDRKRADEKAQLLSQLVEQSNDSIMFTGLSFNIIYMNPAAERLFGWKTEELSGKTPGLFNADPNADNIQAEIYQAVSNGNVYFGEELNRRKDGSRFICQFKVSPIYDENSNIIGYMGFQRDITESKQAEEEKQSLETQLAQAQKMEAVGRLAGGVAHDFNNMLGVILGHAEILLEQVGSDQPIHANVSEIMNAAERSADLTGQLLTFARKQTVSPKVIDLNKALLGMSRMLQRLIGEDIDLVWKPGSDLWTVRVDPGQVDQVLANLCVNARDAIAGVGKITIETHNTILDEADFANHSDLPPGEYVMLAVSDDGCGMEAETLDNLFEPFFTTKERRKGTGLGLATVYGVIKQNSGFINVDSHPGLGTTFRIYLPRHRGESTPLLEKRKRQDRPVEHGHETILVVEDEEAILTLTTVMLERLGYHVLVARTPAEAIRRAQEYAGDIQLLLTDVIMPGMNGRDLARNIIASYPDIKCLFMSGYTADVIAHHGALEQGMGLLRKPFSRESLGAKVREALDQD